MPKKRRKLKMCICDSIFIGNQKFNYDPYNVINTSFGFIHKLDNSIRVINTTKRDIPVRCACDNCRITTKKVEPQERIYGIPAKVYGDIIRFKTAGWKKIDMVTCNETPTKLSIIKLGLTLYKKHFNIRKYILPFRYLKYKSNINVISTSDKHFEYILHEERTVVPKMNCCVFDYYLTDNKAVYILMLMISAQLGGKEVRHTFFGAANQESISFKT
jgi:hypothetical protein